MFKERRGLLEFYNTLRGPNYTNPEDLEIDTLENVVYTKMENGLSFLVKEEQRLHGHQSMANPNMPLRRLFYLTDLFRKMIREEGKKLYGSGRIKIPTPYYVVFYSGIQNQSDRQIVKFSDSYTIRGEEPPRLKMTALVLNVNLGHSRELTEKCRKLQEYAQFAATVRRYHEKDADSTTAVNHATDEYIQNNILAEFLMKSRAEVTDMLWYEYDREEHITSEREINYAEEEAVGRTKGKAEECQLMLELVPPMVRDGLVGETERLREDKEFCNSMLEKYRLL